MGSIRKINIKNPSYYFHNDMINIKNLDPNQIKIDRKYYNDFTIYYIDYVTMKDHSSIHGVNPLYLIFDDVDEYIKEINGNKYLVFASTDKKRRSVDKIQRPLE